jgi:hypothetical protein
MKSFRTLGLVVLIVLPAGAEPAKKKTPKEALRAFNDLIGSWRGTGEPFGTREEKLKGFWTEKIAWQWQFKDKDAWLVADITKGKYFTKAELRYLPEKDAFRLKLTTTGKEDLTFEGKLAKRLLTVERTDPKSKETQRLVVRLLHFNRHLVTYEVKPADHTVFTRVWQVGATKEGVDFATVDEGPECVVSGGLGTIPVTYKGKTYHVCCTGCRDAFKDNPEMYIREYEARRKAKKKGKSPDE